MNTEGVSIWEPDPNPVHLSHFKTIPKLRTISIEKQYYNRLIKNNKRLIFTHLNLTIIYFHIIDKDNKPIILGKLVLIRQHTTCSEINKTPCFLVYMHGVELDKDKFKEWANKHLKHNEALGSGSESAGSEYDYIEFSLGKFRNDYDFIISDNKHRFV